MAWVVSATLLMVLPSAGQAAEWNYKSFLALPAANTIGLAPMLVAPSDPNLFLTIKRIRISGGASTTNPSYIFVANASSQVAYQTTDLTGCAYPTCYTILAADGVKEGWVYNYDGLDVRFGPQERLYFYATADISSESKKVSIEVWYTEGGGTAPLRPSDGRELGKGDSDGRGGEPGAREADRSERRRR
jgi:hypothetical protein